MAGNDRSLAADDGSRWFFAQVFALARISRLWPDFVVSGDPGKAIWDRAGGSRVDLPGAISVHQAPNVSGRTCISRGASLQFHQSGIGCGFIRFPHDNSVCANIAGREVDFRISMLCKVGSMAIVAQNLVIFQKI